LLEPAIETQTRLLNEFGRDLDGVTLIPCHGDVFVVTVDSEMIWDKEIHGADLDLELIVDAINDRLARKLDPFRVHARTLSSRTL
jgi:selenoprotein W-related protein